VRLALPPKKARTSTGPDVELAPAA
jgi:hypothetical protein